MGAALRILVVEDDPHLRKLCTFALGLDEELEVETCASGEEALSAIAASKPDLVLLDMELPGMSGGETAARIDASIPVVYMTGNERVAVPERVRGVVKKPFDPITLAATLRGFR